MFVRVFKASVAFVPSIAIDSVSIFNLFAIDALMLFACVCMFTPRTSDSNISLLLFTALRFCCCCIYLNYDAVHQSIASNCIVPIDGTVYCVCVCVTDDSNVLTNCVSVCARAHQRSPL